MIVSNDTIKNLKKALPEDILNLQAPIQLPTPQQFAKVAAMNFTAIDFETANYKSDSACSLGIVRVENSRIVHQQVYLIKPPYPAHTWRFSYIHGLTYEDVKNAPSFAELWPQIICHFQQIDFVAAHNISFDLKVLNSLSQTFNLQVPNYPTRCSMKIARTQLKMRKYGLADVCKNLNIALNHHEALSDASACAQIILYAELQKQEVDKKEQSDIPSNC